MIKKISFIIIITCLIFSCGKKGDPEFKTFKKIQEIKIYYQITLDEI